MPRGEKTREDGEGTVYQRKVNGQSKGWAAEKLVIDPRTGDPIKRVYGYAKTPELAVQRRYKKEVAALLEAHALTRDEVRQIDPKLTPITTGEYLNRWLQRQTGLRQTSLRVWENHIALHIIPALGSIPLHQLRRDEIYDFLHQTLPNKLVRGKKLSATTVKNVSKTLAAALKEAVAMENLTHNPMESMKLPKAVVAKTEIQTWTPQYILQKLEGDPEELRWLLAFIYGLRQSEALGLTDDSWRIRKKGQVSTLLIKQVLDEDTRRHGCGPRLASGGYPCGAKFSTDCPKVEGTGEVYISRHTKSTREDNSGIRVLPLVDTVVRAYANHMKAQRAIRASADFRPASGEGMNKLTFTLPNGQPRRHKTDNQRWHEMFDRINAGIAEPSKQMAFFRQHNARKTTATILAHMGVPPEIARLVLGHSDVSTFEYYAYRNQEQIIEPLQKVEAFMTERMGADNRLSLVSLERELQAEADEVAVM